MIVTRTHYLRTRVRVREKIYIFVPKKKYIQTSDDYEI